MTEIEEAMKLIGPGCVCEVNMANTSLLASALRAAIEQHEAYKQRVSEAVEAVFAGFNDAYCPWTFMHNTLGRFIIPNPVDPLVEAVGDAMQAHEVYSKYELTDSLRIALAARGGRIVFDQPEKDAA